MECLKLIGRDRFPFEPYKSSMSDKIIIYGGSFDPPHQGHRALAEHVKKIFKPDKIIVVPCFIHALKKNQTSSPEHRMQMVKLMFGNSDFFVSDYEIKKGDVSYTIDTIKYFKKLLNDVELYFLMGEDSLLDIKKWKDYEALLKICKFIVVQRDLNNSSSLVMFATSLEEEYGTQINIVDDFYHPASSTKIREKLFKGIKPEYINPDIFSYIRKHNLYGVPNSVQ